MKNRQPFVSVIIPNYNAKPFLKRCIESVLATSYPRFEVIFLDDASTDGSVELVNELFASVPNLKVVSIKKRLGLAASLNFGINQAKGDYIAFVETDMEVEPNWLNELIKVLESDDSIGAAQGKILDIKNHKRIVSLGVYIIPSTGWVIDRGLGEEDKGTYERIVNISSGEVGLVMKREVITKIGGFDSELIRTTHDIDFCWRIWLGGYRIVYVPKSIVFHWTFKPHEVRKKAISRLDWEFQFNKVPRIFIKNYELKNLIKYLPWALIFMLLRSFMSLLKKDIIPLIGSLKATLWNLKVLRNTFIERGKIQKWVRRVPDNYLMEKIMVKGPPLATHLRYFLYKKSIVERYPLDS